MSGNMVGRGAAVVGVLIALKLLFGRRRKPKQNKKQNRELDSVDMVQFTEVKKTEETNDSAQEERTHFEQQNVKEYFAQDERNVDDILSQKLANDAPHAEDVSRSQQINSYAHDATTPVIVDLEIADQDRIQLQLQNSDENLQHDTKQEQLQLHTQIQQADFQKVNVEFKVDQKNNVEVFFDGDRKMQEMQQIQEIQKLEGEPQQQIYQSQSEPVVTEQKEKVQIQPYLSDKQISSNQNDEFQGRVEQLEKQLYFDQKEGQNLQQKSEENTTSSFQENIQQSQLHVELFVDNDDVAHLQLEDDSNKEITDLNNSLPDSQMKKQKSQNILEDYDDDVNSMQVETSSQTTQFSIPDVPPPTLEKPPMNFDHETIEEIEPIEQPENQENLEPKNVQQQQTRHDEEKKLEILKEDDEKQRVLEMPTKLENKEAETEEKKEDVKSTEQKLDGEKEINEQNLEEKVVIESEEKNQQQQNGQDVEGQNEAEKVVSEDQQDSDIRTSSEEVHTSDSQKEDDTQTPQLQSVNIEKGILKDDEKLSESEQASQKMVGMANKLWGNGTPTEIKRAVKMQSAALEKLQESDARPVHVAQVASSLADMQYALNDLTDTRESLQVALTAANKTDDVALTSKLSNNLGQILRQMKNFEAAKNLHMEYMERFEPEYGVGHHYTCLARQNLVESLEALDQLDEAHKILHHSSETCIHAINELENPSPIEEQTEEGEQNVGRDEADIEKEVALGEGEAGEVGITWTYICSGRVLTEQARFEVSHKDGVGDINKAEDLLRLALTYVQKGEGVDGESSATPLSYLGKVLSVKGGKDALEEAYEVYERLRQISVKRDGENSQSVALVLHTQADVLGQLEKYQQAIELEEQSLNILKGIVKQKYHMGLIKHYEALAKLKQAAGDEEGAQAASRDVLLCKKRHQEEQLKLKRSTASSQSSSSKSSSLSKSSSKKRSKKKNK